VSEYVSGDRRLLLPQRGNLRQPGATPWVGNHRRRPSPTGATRQSLGRPSSPDPRFPTPAVYGAIKLLLAISALEATLRFAVGLRQAG